MNTFELVPNSKKINDFKYYGEVVNFLDNKGIHISTQYDPINKGWKYIVSNSNDHKYDMINGLLYKSKFDALDDAFCKLKIWQIIKYRR